MKAQSDGYQVHCIHSDHVSFAIAFAKDVAPYVVHWGRRISDAQVQQIADTSFASVMNSSFDRPRTRGLLDTVFQGNSGTPAIQWCTDEGKVFPFIVEQITADSRTIRIVYRARQSVDRCDDTSEVLAEVTQSFELDNSGVLSVKSSVRNAGRDGEKLFVSALNCLLPLPLRAQELVDCSGKWAHERELQRQQLRNGSWRRGAFRGKPGHDSPYLTVLGTRGFSFRSGEVWGCHIAWSGNCQVVAERLPEGCGVHSAVLGGGELLQDGEIILSSGEEYESPMALFMWSDHGLDGLSKCVHTYVRSWNSLGKKSRPVSLNTWEAVYFQHDEERLINLARSAASIGLERFVLDDGWFLGRRDDQAGLGDWFVDSEVWPNGLTKLSNCVHELGMEFGLWFEPEMVNLNSDFARQHPDWILGELSNLSWRHQFVVDLSREEVSSYLEERICALVEEYRVDYIKWDHNRDLFAAISPSSGRVSVHQQTIALYDLLQRIRSRFPALEIESCASGGGRIDLGILRYTDRVWASDCIDPLERLQIHQSTELLVPPEYIGMHVGDRIAHTTHRTTDLATRMAAALFGHAGIEWDLLSCSSEELDELRKWIEIYKAYRHRLHSGITINADFVPEGCILRGIVAEDSGWSLFAFARLHTSSEGYTPRIIFPGLAPDRRYRIRVLGGSFTPSLHQISGPTWLDRESREPFVFDGDLLISEGLPLPYLNPGQILLIELESLSQSHR